MFTYPLFHFEKIPFLPMLLAVAWVNRWTFSSSPPSPPTSSHLQLFVSLRSKNAVGVWVLHCDAILLLYMTNK